MSEAHGSPGKPRAAEAALIIFGLTVAAIGLEGVSSLIEHRAAPKLGYAPVRGKRARQPMNSAGYRDVEHPKDKAPGTRRAVFIGDSFTYGVGVLLDDAYPKKVERALSEARHETWESLVFAVPGIDSEQEETIFEHEALDYEPDLVVLGYVLNDAEDPDSAERRRAEEWRAAQDQRRNPPWWRASAFFRLVADRVHATQENRARVKNHLALYNSDSTGFRSARRAIERMATLCRERNIPFIVVVFPLFANPMDDSYPFKTIHEKVGAFCKSQGIDLVDLLPFYRDVDWPLLVVEGAADEHPNELAHRIASQALVGRIDSLVPAQAPAEPVWRRQAARASHR